MDNADCNARNHWLWSAYLEGSSAIFLEPLPDQCPPLDAEEVELVEVYRMLKPEPLTADTFTSYAAQGLDCPPGVDPCRWASCSLSTKPSLLKKIPKFKNCTSAVKITIPANAGRSKVSGNHIDFWAYAGFSFLSADHSVVGV